MANAFSLGETVSKSDNTKIGGVIKYISCFYATSSGKKICKKLGCANHPNDYIWVKWPDGSVCSYAYTELKKDIAAVVVDAEIKEVKVEANINNTESSVEQPAFDFDFYTGAKEVRTDRSGRQFVWALRGQSQEKEVIYITEEELDFDRYNFGTGSPIKKTRV